LVDVSVRPLPHPQARLSTIVVPREGLNQRPPHINAPPVRRAARDDAPDSALGGACTHL